MSDQIRIIIADDHDILREGLRGILQKQPDIEIVGEADNGRNAVELAKELSPDIVIMDITMPDLNGIEATRRILKEIPGIQIIALSMHNDRQFVRRMLDVGASGYLLKQSASRELVTAIRAVRAGNFYLSKLITDISIEELFSEDGTYSRALLNVLTAKEREVLQLVAEGYSTKQIAEKLYLSENTVEKHRQHIMDKLNKHSVAELTKYAIREGITSLNK